MTEIQLQWLSFSKIIFLAFYSLLWGLGGMNGKWKRRLLGSGVLTLGIVVFSLIQQSFSVWYLLCFLLFWGATSLGYGADDVKEKIIKRTYCGLAYGTASLPVAIITGSWVLFGFHLLLCTLVSNILGVVNPVEAREEETIIPFIVGFLPLFML